MGKLIFVIFVAVILVVNLSCFCKSYEIGVGIADSSGPIVGVTFMGYGNLEQQGTGLHTRQWSRAFIIKDGENRFVFVSVDIGMMGDGVRKEVIAQLEEKYNGIYNMDNVMISATHTHSAPGGYLMHTLFDISTFGFCKQTFDAITSGIVKSISKAHQSLQKGKLYLTKGEVLNVNINRSPNAYEANPKEERERYPHNVDKQMTQLRFESDDGTPLGVINWFAVHPTSMNNTNTLSSADNVGYASIKFEEAMNPEKLLGKGPFVAAFASSNLGDVSPNVMGPKCQKSGKDCDIFSRCDSMFDSCFASGPGKDMLESTKMIGERLFDKAWDLWNVGEYTEIKGPVKSIHQYVDMPTAEGEILNKTTGEMVKIHGCMPAMGYSFAAGTIDGPFSFIMKQGMTTNGDQKWWLDSIRNTAVAKPSKEDIECHSPKPILLPTGQMVFPFEWQPRVVSTQLAKIGNVAIAGVPGEFTTMSGRRVRDVIHETLSDVTDVIIAGLSNTYSDYITTYEEYQVQRFEAAATLYGPHTLTLHLKQYKKLALSLKLVQRYEGASTLFGPHTLSLHLVQFKKLAQTFLSDETLERGPEPKGLVQEEMLSLIPPIVFDSPKIFHSFGDVLLQPEVENQHGDVVVATFIAGHPRNNLKLDDTYCTVERLDYGDVWTVIATDANWETKVQWRRTLWVLGNSEIDIEWTIPKHIKSGWYRIRHFGSYKTLSGAIHPYEGTSREFQVHSPREVCLLRPCKNIFLC